MGMHLLSSFNSPKWKKVRVTHSCPTLCDPMDYTAHGILQARIPEWVAFPFSRGSSQPRDQTQVSHIAGRFFASWATREVQEYGVGSLSLLQGSSQPRNQTRVSCTAGGFFTNWVAKSPIYVTCSFEPKIQVEAALSKYPEPGHGHQGQSVLLWGRATALAQAWGLWGD